MTFSVVGLWEIGYNTPLVEYSQWEFMLREFGCEELIMSPVSGILAGVEQHFLRESNDLSATIEAQRSSGKQIVFLDEAGDTDLRTLRHPRDCCYVMGRSSQKSIVYRKPEDVVVKIPTHINRGGLWSHQAAAIVLYDRFLKVGA